MSKATKNKASIAAVLGASGSGKSTFVKRAIEQGRPKRLLISDPMREYTGVGVVCSHLAQVVGMIEKSGADGFRIVFHYAADDKLRARQFNALCAIALAAGNLTFVAEELKFFTTPSRAPLRWAEVTMTGRHKGLRVIGTSQRPASIDKDFLGNCTLIRTGRLVYPEDISAVAKAMRVPEAEIEALAPLDWIEKDMQSGKKISGRLTF